MFWASVALFGPPEVNTEEEDPSLTSPQSRKRMTREALKTARRPTGSPNKRRSGLLMPLAKWRVHDEQNNTVTLVAKTIEQLTSDEAKLGFDNKKENRPE